MPKKKLTPDSVEQKEFRIFNPDDVKQAIEIPVKPKPKLEELEIIEKIGKKPKKTGISKPKLTIKSSKGSYILIITEKPQAAAKIAAALSNGKDKRVAGGKGVYYYELERNNKKIIVACAVGHLFSVSQNKKESGYPVFDIGWKPNFEVRKRDFTKNYYLAIQRLAKNASEIIVATDFDIEGEVIGYNIVRFIANRDDAKRMKFSSLTAEELQNSYENSLPTIEWGQAIAGETRHLLDWLYGINLSRALMHAISSTGKFRIMSIGRVQGPALHLIVEKEKQIQAFKPTPYWQVFLIVNDGKNKLEVKYVKDITKKQELDKFKDLKNKKAIASTTKSKQTIIPPAPFDLTTLQTEAYKFHYINPARTLQIAQQLYLSGLISYPRTSSQKIPEAMQPQKILKQLSKDYENLTKHATRDKPIEGSKSDPAHPAIIPTGIYQKLQAEDEKIYNLIVKRFISCFCDNAELENKKVEVIINDLKFNARGMEILNPGWMNVYPVKMEEKEIKDMNGETIIEKVNIIEKQTQPPNRYSPASIIKELEKRNLGTKCLTGDTKIIANNQEIFIQDLFKNYQKYKKEGDTEIKKLNNIKTISLNKKEDIIITDSEFISKRKIKENEKIIKIDTESSTIKLTENHLIYIYQNGQIQQIPAKNLSINDKLIGTTKKYNEGKPIIEKSIFNNNYRINKNEIKHKFSSKTSKGILISKFPIKWSTSLAWILGYYYGDGSYSNPKYNGAHQIYFTTTEKKALSLIEDRVYEIFGNKPYSYNLNGTYKVNLNAIMSYALIKVFSELEGKKPIDIPKEFIGDFLRGFFDADGNVHLRPLGKTIIKGVKCNSFDTPRVKITLSSKTLIEWVSSLLTGLGIKNHINKNVSLCNGKKFDCWTILISGRDKIEKFAYLIGFDSYKEDILYKGLKCSSPKYKILSDCAAAFLLLNKQSLIFEELAKKLNISNYNSHLIFKRLFKLGLVTKRRYGKNVWVFSAKPSKNYFNYAMKIVYKKAKKDIYLVPIKSIGEISYSGYVYDLSVNENSPNFITQGNILVHNSTRANIIETLYQRNYVKGKSIQATELGIKLIDSLGKHSPIIIDEKLTRNFEKDMEAIRASKKELNKKQEIIIKKAQETLIKISNDFKKQEKEIGKELNEANQAIFEQEKQDNKLGIKCPQCKKGELTIKYTPRFRSYFIACTEYPNCKQTFPLPSQSLIKKTEKICEECKWPMLLRIKQGKRPWIFCPNPKCESKKDLDINGNTKEKEQR